MVYAPSCAAVTASKGGCECGTTSYGQMPTLRASGCSRWPQPERQRANLERVITDRKAGCGKTACPVWREGWRDSAIPTPIYRNRVPRMI